MPDTNITETTPLLGGANQQDSDADVLVVTVESDDSNVQAIVKPNDGTAGILPKDPESGTRPLGPLEISASERRLILAGIWMGTCLSVRTRSVRV